MSVRKGLYALSLVGTALLFSSCSVTTLRSLAVGPALTANPSSLTFPSEPVGTSSPAQVVTISNTGSTSVTINSISAVGPFSVSGVVTPKTLAVGKSVTLSVVFTPNAIGPTNNSAAVQVNSTVPTSPTIVSLVGTGTQPNGPSLIANPTSTSFGSVLVGQTGTAQQVTLTNFGTATTTINSVLASAGVTVSGASAGTVVAPNGGTVILTINFAPTAPGATSSSTAVTVLSNAPNSPLAISVSGVGIQPAIAVSPGSLEFGLETLNATSISLPVTISNPGTATLHIQSIASSIPQFSVTGFSAGTAVNVGASTTVMVSFTPSAAQQYPGQLNVTSDAPTSPAIVSLDGTGTSQTNVANLLPAAVSFNGVFVGQTSPPQTVLVTNGGTMNFQVTSVTTALPFVVSGFASAQTLAPGKSLSLSVTLDPMATGSISGALTVSFDSLAAVVATLTGEGVGSCMGVPLAQAPAPIDVTSNFTSVSAGVKITQLTSSGSNYLTYIGLPAFSAPVNQIVYNNTTGNLTAGVTAVPDGTGSQLVSTGSVERVHLSWDGRLATFDSGGNNPGTFDLFGVFLDSKDSHNIGSACATVRLTSLNMPLAPGNVVLKFSEGAPRPSDGKEVIPFAPASAIRRVLEDGTLLDGDLNSPGIDPPDSYQGQNYHRLRLNPKFPQWIEYSRDKAGSASGTPELWLLNFDTLQLCSVGPLGTTLNHDAWSPDGTTIVAQNPNNAHALMIPLFDSNGNLLPGINCPVPTPGNPPQVSGATITDISVTTGQPANYCDFPPDGSPILVCTSGAAAVVNPATGQAVLESVYLLAQNGSSYKYITSTDAQALSDPGIPLTVFIQDSSHLLFRSDKSGVPQIYLVTGFNPTLP